MTTPRDLQMFYQRQAESMSPMTMLDRYLALGRKDLITSEEQHEQRVLRAELDFILGKARRLPYTRALSQNAPPSQPLGEEFP